MKGNLEFMVELGELEGPQIDPILNRIQLMTDLNPAAESAIKPGDKKIRTALVLWQMHQRLFLWYS